MFFRIESYTLQASYSCPTYQIRFEDVVHDCRAEEHGPDDYQVCLEIRAHREGCACYPCRQLPFSFSNFIERLDWSEPALSPRLALCLLLFFLAGLSKACSMICFAFFAAPRGGHTRAEEPRELYSLSLSFSHLYKGSLRRFLLRKLERETHTHTEPRAEQSSAEPRGDSANLQL